MSTPVWISHLGHSEPGPALPQERVVDWLARRLAPGSDESRLRRFAERSGIESRHSVLDLDHGEADAFYPPGGSARPSHDAVSAVFAAKAPGLALEAVRAACPDGIGRVTHVVVATCTGAVAPGLDIDLVRALALGQGVRRTMVGFMGCYAAVPALRIARDTCRGDPGARVLVVCCELCSLHLEPGPRDDAMLAACLFADGAAAAVVEAGPDPIGAGVALGADCSLLGDDDGEIMAWRAGSNGFRLNLSPYVSRALGADLEPLVAAMAPNGAASVDWLVHPGGPRILDTFTKRLDLAPDTLDRSRAALAAGGNRSSATVLAMLADAVDAGWCGQGVAVGFGPGLTIDALGLERA